MTVDPFGLRWQALDLFHLCMAHSQMERGALSDLLTTQEVADRLRTPAATVRYWRHTNYGPRSIKVGRRVLYREADVEAFLESLASKA